MYESSLNEKREETALLNKELKRLDNHLTSNNGNNGHYVVSITSFTTYSSIPSSVDSEDGSD